MRSSLLTIVLIAMAAGVASAQRVTPSRPPADVWELPRSEFLTEATWRAKRVDFARFRKPGTYSDTHALRLAISEARRQGAWVVHVPAGRYEMTGEVPLETGVSLVGEGCGRTTLVRSRDHRGQILFRVEGDTAVRIEGMGFDYVHAREFFRAVGFRGEGSADIVVRDNCFFDSRPNTSGGDRWGVELTSSTFSSRVRISGNRVTDWIQLTAGSGGGVRKLWITDNTVEEAEQNAIAVSQLGDNALLEDVEIARNVIRNAHSIGIYVGPDKPTAKAGRIRRVRIHDNRIEGFPHRKYGIGIFIRAAETETSDIVVERNQIVGTSSREATGIRFANDHGAEREFQDVRILGNLVRGFSRSIWIGPVLGGEVRGNRITGSRPFTISPRAKLRVSDNVVSPQGG